MKIKDLENGSWVKQKQPVLNVGAFGEWDDLMVDCPCVFLKEPNKYGLFYTGHAIKNSNWGIGFATSDDLVVWQKYKKNPVINSVNKKNICEKIDAAAVVKYKNAYFLFFESASHPTFFKSCFIDVMPYFLRQFLGMVRRTCSSCFSTECSQVVKHAQGRTIGFVTSSDLINWKFHENNPVFCEGDEGSWDRAGVFSPCLVAGDDEIFMFYGGSDGQKVRTGLATSDNFCTWRRNGSCVLDIGKPGAWDEGSVLMVSILKLDDGYVAFYEGQDKNNQYAIGLAFSKDCKIWSKHGKNPILTKGNKGDFDERIINSPHGFIDKEKIFLFYGAQDFKMHGHCMIAFFQKN